MSIRLLLSALYACLLCWPAWAQPELAPTEVWVENSFYPEGPVYFQGRWFFVEYSKHRVMVYDPQKDQSQVYWQEENCGPAGLVAVSEHKLWVSCYDSNTLVELASSPESPNKAFKQRSLYADDQGLRFQGPNDFVRDAFGGLYFTASGRFATDAPAQGRIFYRSREGRIRQVAQGIHYANGLALMHHGSTLVVSEHLKNRLLAFRVGDNGELSQRFELADLPALAPLLHAGDPLTGPDGLYALGNTLWVAHYGAARILELEVPFEAPVRLRELHLLSERYPTNVFWHNGSLVITAVEDGNTAPYQGKLLRLKQTR